MARIADSNAAYFAAEEWEPLICSAESGDRSPLFAKFISLMPTQYQERGMSAIAAERPASVKTKQLADAVLEHKRLTHGGMKDGDAFKLVCGKFKIKKEKESVLGNALSGNRHDLNKELRRRANCQI